MVGFGANAYRQVSVQTQVASADPHKLVLMLYDGALDSMKLALVAMQNKDIQTKCNAITKASRIIEEGLKAGLDRDVDPVLCRRLGMLYDYVLMRLLEANLKNNEEYVQESIKLIGGLRDTWAEIEDQVKHMDIPMHSVQSGNTPNTGARW